MGRRQKRDKGSSDSESEGQTNSVLFGEVEAGYLNATSDSDSVFIHKPPSKYI